MEFTTLISAAGFSRRAGVFKPALQIDGLPLLHRCIKTAQSASDSVYVVSGYKKEIIEKLVNKLNNIYLTHNENYAEGMFSSIKKGLRKIQKDFQSDKDFYVFFTPGDYPYIQQSTYKEMKDFALKNKPALLLPSYQNKSGHPILFHSSLIQDIINTKEKSLRDFFRSYFREEGLRKEGNREKENGENSLSPPPESLNKKMYLNTADSGILYDIDRIEDIKR